MRAGKPSRSALPIAFNPAADTSSSRPLACRRVARRWIRLEDRQWPRPREIEACDGVVTASFAASPTPAPSCCITPPAKAAACFHPLPDWHLCILRASQVVETLARILRSLPNLHPCHLYLRPQRHGRHRDDAHQGRPRAALSQRHPGPRSTHARLHNRQRTKAGTRMKPPDSALFDLAFKSLDSFQIEIPSWGFANTGTRFGKFVQACRRLHARRKIRRRRRSESPHRRHAHPRAARPVGPARRRARCRRGAGP